MIKIGVTRPVGNLDAVKPCFWLSLKMVGAKAIFLDSKNKAVSCLDALILSGGADVEPSRYGEDLDGLIDYDPQRDSFELDVLQQMLAQKKPVMGICRGLQLLNVGLGGTLHTEIAKVYDIEYTPRSFLSKAFYRKTVFIEPDSFLEPLTSKHQMRVNSIHHQSINKLGQGLKRSAYDQYDIIQAVEDRARKIYGVQWHPEFMMYRRDQQRIFQFFIDQINA